MDGTTFGILTGKAALVALTASLVWAACSDLRCFRIPNVASVFVVLAAMMWAVTLGQGGGAHFGVGVIALAVGAGLYSLGVFGAGDAKLAAALVTFVGPAEAVSLVLQIAVLGGVLTFIWVSSRPVRLVLCGFGFDVEPSPPNRIPYGVAIAAAGLLFVLRQWPVQA